jgi:hypothetical protein
MSACDCQHCQAIAARETEQAYWNLVLDNWSTFERRQLLAISRARTALQTAMAGR